MVVRSFFPVAMLFLIALPARSQEQWSWPEKPQNLQVLPKDWPGSRLSPVMRGFTNALGVRCSYCHKGEEGKPLTTYDFASDENPNKNRAREMLRMLSSVNEHLKKIEPSGEKRVNMWCHTCHQGRPRPATLEEELTERYELNGIESALQRYADLKKRFYGRGAYDFGVGSLNSFGYGLLRKNDVKGAIRIFTMNTEQFPEVANAWDSLAEAYMKSGDMESATKYYEKVLQMDPDSENAKAMLKKIKEGN